MVSLMTDAEQKSYENEGGLHNKEETPENTKIPNKKRM